MRLFCVLVHYYCRGVVSHRNRSMTLLIPHLRQFFSNWWQCLVIYKGDTDTHLHGGLKDMSHNRTLCGEMCVGVLVFNYPMNNNPHILLQSLGYGRHYAPNICGFSCYWIGNILLTLFVYHNNQDILSLLFLYFTVVLLESITINLVPS